MHRQSFIGISKLQQMVRKVVGLRCHDFAGGRVC
jgi:hypothetical protein